MYILYISGEICQETVDKFLTQFNKIPFDQPITVYINSIGGDVQNGQVLLHILDTHADRITLVACGEISSMAFNIFFFAKCKKELAEDTLGMAHLMYATIEINEGGSAISEGNKFLLDEMKAYKPRTIDRFKSLGFNQKELSKLRANKDVYFSYQRLKQLLNGQAKSNKLNRRRVKKVSEKA